MASGIFIVPILTIIAGVDVRVAIGAGIVSVIACSCGSAASFLKQRLINVRLAVVLEAATTLGAASGVLLAGAMSVPVLYGMFAAVLLVSAWQMLTRRRTAPEPARSKPAGGWTRRLDSTYPDRASGDVAYRVDRLPAGLALMYGAGLLSALLGIGSGVLKIPGNGHRPSFANQGFIGNVELHDRCDGCCECRRLFHARRNRPWGRGSGRLGVSGRGGPRCTPADVHFADLASLDFRGGFACPGDPDGPRVSGYSRRIWVVMTPATSIPYALNRRLAWLLGYGSWASCVLIAAGMMLPSAGAGAQHLISAGIVLLIALPIIRVAAMSVWFFVHRDRDFALIAALVLAIIVASTLLGTGAA